jgi:hypothetical protein
MRIALSVCIAVVVTGLLFTAALFGVGWFMNSPTVLAVAREPWFQPLVFVFNATFVPMIAIWVALRKLRTQSEPASIRISPIRD